MFLELKLNIHVPIVRFSDFIDLWILAARKIIEKGKMLHILLILWLCYGPAKF